MLRKSEEKLNVYLYDVEDFIGESSKCLTIGRYRFGSLAIFHEKVIFEDGIYRRKLCGPKISSIEAEYELGALYYDFIKGLKELNIELHD